MWKAASPTKDDLRHVAAMVRCIDVKLNDLKKAAAALRSEVWEWRLKVGADNRPTVKLAARQKVVTNLFNAFQYLGKYIEEMDGALENSNQIVLTISFLLEFPELIDNPRANRVVGLNEVCTSSRAKKKWIKKTSKSLKACSKSLDSVRAYLDSIKKLYS